MPDAVTRRLVLHVAGYDPMTAEVAHHRFVRELARFRATWSVKAEAGPPSLSQALARWRVVSSGPDWSVETDVIWLRWDDVMARFGGVSPAKRVVLGLRAFADFVQGGALLRYARHNWRYALFFLYPPFVLTLCAFLAALGGWAVGAMAGSAWAGVAAGTASFIGIVYGARRYLLLDHMLDDWIFAREHIRRPDPTLTARLESVADELVRAVEGGDYGEVLVIGHSLGAVLAIEIIDRALEQRPRLGTDATTFSLVTVGSSIPKIAFHRAASAFRAKVRRVGEAEGVVWVDYQARSDIMNFHRLHPVRGTGAGIRGPFVRLVSIRKMLDKDYYRRIRTNYLRIHNQLVSGNAMRTAYDYFILICGPDRLERIATLEAGAADCLAEDGSLRRGTTRRYTPEPGLDRSPP